MPEAFDERSAVVSRGASVAPQASSVAGPLTRWSPGRVVVVLATSIFVCEMAVMVTVSFLPPYPPLLLNLLDSALLVVLLLPLLYFLVFRRLVMHVAEQRRMAAAVEATAESIVIADSQGMIQYVNPAFERLTGCAREDTVGQDLGTFTGNDRDDLGHTSAWTERLLGTDENGTAHDVETTAALIRGETGELVGSVFVMRDVTSAKKLQEQLVSVEKLEAVAQLGSGVAHDFNNIITGIVGCAEQALDAVGDNQAAAEHLTTLLGACADASMVTRELAALSDGETFGVRPINLNETVEHATSFLRRVIPVTIELSLELDPSLDAIDGDSTAVERIVTNLCVNARDAMPHGGLLTLKTAMRAADPSGAGGETATKATATLSVSDTGCGMTADVRRRIFEPFFTTKSSGHGSGLGLATVHRLVSHHQGSIECRSEVGKGTTFTIHFPRASTQPPDEDPPSKPQRSLPCGDERILLVEDDPNVLDALRSTLGSLGYVVSVARGGKEAVDHYRENPGSIDLVISDVIMPKMGGRELYRTLSGTSPRCRWLFISGYFGTPARGVEDLPPGVELLQKPFTRRDLALRVRELLDERP